MTADLPLRRHAAKGPPAYGGRGHLAAIVATFLWGMTGPLVKLLIAETGFMVIGAARATIAAMVLATILVLRRGPRALVIPLRDLPPIIALTIFGWVCSQVAWLFAISLIPVSVTAILSNTSPIFVAFMAVFWLRERLRPRAAVGLVISFVGVVLLVTGGGGQIGALNPLGAGSAIVSAALWAAYTVGSRPLLARYETLRIVTCNAIIAAVFWLPLASLLELPLPRTPPAWVWVGTLYIGAVPMALGSVLWYEAIRRLTAVQVGALGYLVPFWSVVASASLLGEPLTLPLVVGGLLIFGGTWLTQTR